MCDLILQIILLNYSYGTAWYGTATLIIHESYTVSERSFTALRHRHSSQSWILFWADALRHGTFTLILDAICSETFNTKMFVECGRQYSDTAQ